MARETFKNTALGILVFGVLSSLIASYIWSTWHSGSRPATVMDKGSDSTNQPSRPIRNHQPSPTNTRAGIQPQPSRETVTHQPSSPPPAISEATTAFPITPSEIPACEAATAAGLTQVDSRLIHAKIQKCGIIDNQVRISGALWYEGSADKDFLFDRFTVADENGKRYPLIYGNIEGGTSEHFAVSNYFGVNVTPNLPYPFSLIAGPVDPQNHLSTIILFMPPHWGGQNGFRFDMKIPRPCSSNLAQDDK